MSTHVHVSLQHGIGTLTLDRPQALHALSLDMLRTLTQALLAWRDDPAVKGVLIGSSSEKAFCAGGDIRFFHQLGRAAPQQGSALIEDFFTEEYALNRLIHHYPKPYVALLDGIVMGGGMGIAQCQSAGRLRIVTERTKMAMPETAIGLFPDIGASYFLSRCPGKIGLYLGLTGQTIGATDALYVGLADVFIPSVELPKLRAALLQTNDVHATVAEFATAFRMQADPARSMLATQRERIDRHFSKHDVAAIMASLQQDADPFAQATLSLLQNRSPLMLCVTLEQLHRGSSMTIEACLRMERSMMRHSFEGEEGLEGIRAAVIDKDQSPRWQPASLAEVTPVMVARYFESVWPDYAHPLRDWL
ncbi:MAG: enoyl-CoA hydratase/isomerase family protein [Proteobacteria bacterium]|nr:enoyl-CoA hydratase/isomerase family protein [Pseudomonadota bacterium]